MKQKPWSGRFKESTDRLVDEFNASISFDRRLYRHDIRGSIAHASVLADAGILTDKEARKIIEGLKAVEKEISGKRFAFTPEMEDIHMAVEQRLTEKIGTLGGKLHTGRSRNDQVALDLRLYLKDEIYAIAGLLHEFKKALVDVAGDNLDCVMPGYTHLQRAQPVLLSHHLLAYYEMFKRDTGRLLDCLERMDELPLGSGALAGSPYDLDRRLAARLLGFSRVTENSLDGVSDRDFVLEFMSAASIIMMHASRLSEEIILWSTQEFSFIELSDAFSTGSSIMPQKKNPDVAELARGKTGRVYGHLFALLTTMKGLPLAYNKDMQEDKEPLFDAVDTLKDVLIVYPPMLRTMKVNKEAMFSATSKGFLNATDAADYLVKKGLPFREAHRAAGAAVAYCIEKGITLEDLGLDEWRGFSRLFGPDIRKAVSIKNSVDARKIYGGTALETVKKRLKAVKNEIKKGIS
ncbi:MAG: argininosuccinate lyase [Deltaproteobacteria bacterium]|nr:argininosuccinate lyase [Deltaproteobacteria bacterium]